MRSYVVALAAVGIAGTLLAEEQQGGSRTATPPVPPRDLSGVWLGTTAVPPLEPTSPMTPKGQVMFNAAKPMYGPRSVPVVESNDPTALCDPLGFPRMVLHQTRGIEFIQTPKKVVQLIEYQKVWREIWTDGRPLPSDVGGSGPTSPDPRLYGYSIGHWEDDVTFIVQTTGAAETGWASEFGHPHGLHARVEERYRRTSPDTLEIVVTIDDPEMYQKPFVAIRQVFKRGTELDEQFCVQSEVRRYMERLARPAAQKK